MLPPPAPIAVTSTQGSENFLPSMICCFTVSTVPSWMTPMSKLVPPMSTDSTLRNSLASPSMRASDGPAAGPDSSSTAGFSLTISGVAMPPLLCMNISWPLKPLSASSPTILETKAVTTGAT